MDTAAKKRKPDENGADAVAVALSDADAAALLAPFTRDQLVTILTSALTRSDPLILAAVRSISDADTAHRKLFVRGLGWDTTSDSLRSAFIPFGPIEEAVVIADKTTNRSKGFGFVTFRHADSAILALKEPSKKIDSRVAIAALASSTPVTGADVSARKIYVGNVQPDMVAERLLEQFAVYGEIEEGPLGIDKLTGKFRGFAMFVYKTVEGARAALVEPTKTIDGHHLVCKVANDPKKANSGAGLQPAADVAVAGPPSLPGQFGQAAVPGPYGGIGGVPGVYSGYPGSAVPAGVGLSYHNGLGSTGLSLAGSQGTGYGSGLTNPYGAGTPYGASGVSAPYGTSGASAPYGTSGASAPYGTSGASAPYGTSGASAPYGTPGSGGYAAGFGAGSSLYRMAPGSGAAPLAGYPESGQYPLPSATYQGHQHQLPAAGFSPSRRYPTGGGVFPSIPPFY